MNVRRTTAVIVSLICVMLAGSVSGASGIVTIAHRGNQVVAPENTLIAYKTAAKAGFAVEIDVWFTKDNKAVIMHDPTVDRMTNGVGTVGSFTFAEIRTLRIDTGENASLFNATIPSLWEALNTIAPYGVPIMLEIKTAPVNDLQRDVIAKAVRDTWVANRTTFMSFTPQVAADMREYALATYGITVATGTYVGAPTVDPAIVAQQVTSIVAPNFAYVVDDTYCAIVHEAGRKCYVWTVDDAPTWAAMAARGVDGILTDKPYELSAWTKYAP